MVKVCSPFAEKYTTEQLCVRQNRYCVSCTSRKLTDTNAFIVCPATGLPVLLHSGQVFTTTMWGFCIRKSLTTLPASGGQPHDSVIEKLPFLGWSVSVVSNEVDQEGELRPHPIDASKIMERAEAPDPRHGSVGRGDTRPRRLTPLSSTSEIIIAQESDLDPNVVEDAGLKTQLHAYSPQ